MTTKPTKSWGSQGETNGKSWMEQRPSELELKLAKLKFSSDSTTITRDCTDEEAAEALASWEVALEVGAIGGTMTYSRSGSPLGSLTLTQHVLMPVIEGAEPLDEVDYGSDGEGGVDTEVWSTAKNRKTISDKYRIEKDDVTHWPPFMEYGHQLMDPKKVTAYKLLIDGHKPGDVFTLGGTPMQLKDTGAGYDTNYFDLLKGEVLVFKEIWEVSWVISNKAHANKYDPGDPEKTVQLPDGWVMSTICKENNGDKDRAQTKKSWTVTRTFVHTELFTGQQVPKGAELFDVRKEAPEQTTTP